MADITKEIRRGDLTVSDLTTGQYQKEGTVTAILRQNITVITTYPGMRVSSDKQDALFSEEEFDATPSTYENVEKRVAFVLVPDDKTKEQVQAKIPATACLYKEMSNQPILTSNHRNAINSGLTSKDEIAESQVVRYPDGHEKEGELILDANGKVQYRKIFFSATQKEDIDTRTSEAAEYLTEALAAEKAAQMGVNIETGEITDFQNVESTGNTF